MAKKASSRQLALQTLPLLAHESLYVGIDVGKQAHVAGFLSKTLLERHDHFEGCPVLTFEQSREGFRALIDRISLVNGCPLGSIRSQFVLNNQHRDLSGLGLALTFFLLLLFQADKTGKR